MTAKYSGAIDLLKRRKIVLPATVLNNQDKLYQALQENGFFWNSNLKEWEEYQIEEADAPTPMVMVRVWADSEVIHEAAEDLIAALKKHPGTKNWQVIEQSVPYQCRPPKQREARIYLKFLPQQKGN